MRVLDATSGAPYLRAPQKKGVLPVDFKDPAVFDRMARAVVTHPHALSGAFVAIVVDMRPKTSNTNG